MPTGRSTVARRTVLRGIGGGSIAALAGCIGGFDADNGDGSGGPPEPETVSVGADAGWRTASLTDATTAEEFRIAELDRPTIVHTFATGCAACQAQHDEFGTFYAESDSDVEIVDLTIDPNDDPETLRTYADEEGFDWRFGIAGDEVTGDLVADFGQEVTVSAEAPVVIVCPGDDNVYRLDKVVDADHLESILADVCGTNG